MRIIITPTTRLYLYKPTFRIVKKFTFLRKVIQITFNNRTIVRNIALIPCLAFLILMASFKTAGVIEYKVDKVVIDAGHGGKDPGTHGLISEEKDIALKIALELGRIIKDNLKDVEVIYTRNNDTFVELDDRANMANKKDADVFISIHCNSVPRNQHLIYGTETYVMGQHTSEGNFEVTKRENSVILLEKDYEERYEGFDPKSPESLILFSLYQNAYINNSLNLADKIEHQFSKRVGRNSRGVRQAGFWVLWRTSMPSVLIEVGYLSNPKEEKYLNDELGQVYLASGIFRAFRDYKDELESNY
ncbi:MAG: N-acetylmuramoyl-L-alanine amidase [Cyclobacteriaceae bacterium]|nr:N-acetylmuramoyl-L-alanine amidase [Cyclobacteriaceae bacterium]